MSIAETETAITELRLACEQAFTNAGLPESRSTYTTESGLSVIRYGGQIMTTRLLEYGDGRIVRDQVVDWSVVPPRVIVDTRINGDWQYRTLAYKAFADRAEVAKCLRYKIDYAPPTDDDQPPDYEVPAQ